MQNEYSENIKEDGGKTETKNAAKSANIATDSHLEVGCHTKPSKLRGRLSSQNDNENSTELIDDIIKLHNDPKGNKLLWYDNWEDKIIDRNSDVILKAIDENVSQFGGLEAYKDIVGINPYDPIEPVCGLSAQNIFKLMTEGEQAVNPVEQFKKEKINGNEFSEKLDQFNDSGSYVALVNDHRFGHMFLIDITSTSQGIVGYIYQSDLGNGVLPALKIVDWLSSRGKEPINADKLKKLLSNEFNILSESEQKKLIAELLEINKNMSNVKLNRFKRDQEVNIYLSKYDKNNFFKNIENLKAKLGI
ncbi:cycle-inhibiting factor [Photorhabdus tasmaniensis]